MNEVTHRDLIPPTSVPIGVAAAHLRVSVDTVRRWEEEGKIKASRTLGGQRRFEISEIERVKAGKPAEDSNPKSVDHASAEAVGS